MTEELLLEGLPLPGEPLTPYIDNDNQSILDDDISERIKRTAARLSKKQIRAIKKELRGLTIYLKESGYNPLILKLHNAKRTYQELRHLFKTQPQEATPQQWSKYKYVKRAGAVLSERVKKLQPYVDRYDELKHKLDEHDKLIAWKLEDKQNFKAFKKEAQVWEQQLNSAFKQSPRLHHRGIDSKGKEFIHIPKIKEIIVKDDRVMYLIKTTTQGIIEKFLGKWHSALPYGVDIASLVDPKTLDNLSASCNRIVTVERSKRGTNLFYVISRLDSPDGIPNRVLYNKALAWYPANNHTKSPWCAGVSDDRTLQWYNFEDIPHVLIAGATQGGKSNHVNQMIATLCSMNTPQELRVLLVDLKGGIEFTHWRGLQHQLRPMLTTTEQVLEGLQWLRSIMERRLEVFEQLKAKNLTSYNEKAKDKLPRLVCFVDEMATLIGLGQLTTDLHTELRVLSAQGRAVGINLVLCTQHSSVDVLPGWVKTNMSLRVSAKMPSHQASMVILDTVTASTLPNVPGRMVFSSGRVEIIAQSPYISDQQIENTVRLANKFTQPDNTEFTDSLPTPKPTFSVDDALDVALRDCMGRLSYRRIFDALNRPDITLNYIRSLMENTIDQALDDGGLTHRGIHYNVVKVRNYYALEEATIEDTQGEKEILDKVG